MQDSVDATFRNGAWRAHCFGLGGRPRDMVDGVEAGDRVGKVVVQQELAGEVLHVLTQVFATGDELLCGEQVTSIAAVYLSRDDCFLREHDRLQH